MTLIVRLFRSFFDCMGLSLLWLHVAAPSRTVQCSFCSSSESQDVNNDGCLLLKSDWDMWMRWYYQASTLHLKKKPGKMVVVSVADSDHHLVLLCVLFLLAKSLGCWFTVEWLPYNNGNCVFHSYSDSCMYWLHWVQKLQCQFKPSCTT